MEIFELPTSNLDPRIQDVALTKLILDFPHSKAKNKLLHSIKTYRENIALRANQSPSTFDEEAKKLSYISENVSKLFFMDHYLYEVVKESKDNENVLDVEGTLNWNLLSEENMMREGKQENDNYT